MSLPILPTELLGLIANHLDAEHLGAFRLTSRILYDNTLDVFAERIANKRWLLRTTSLDVLRAAASIPYLNERLTAFRLGTHGLSSWVERPDEPHWRNTWDAELREQHLLTWRRYETGDRKGQGAKVLANTLQCLQALCRIEIGEWCAPDQNFQIGHAGNETRNGTGQHLNVLYRATWMYTQGVSGDSQSGLHTFDDGDTIYLRSRLSDCFQHVLHALTIMRPGPGVLPLESLSAFLYDSKSKTLHGVLTDQLQKLKEGSNFFKALQPALAHLRELSLAIEVDGSHWLHRMNNSKPQTWLSVFMKLVPSLEVLQLFHDDRDFVVQSWSHHDSLRLFLRDTRLRHLTKLELACARVSDRYFEDFLTFWRCHTGSLKRLTLKCLKLSRESHHAAASNSWPATLEKMSQMPFKLSFLRIEGLYGPDLDPMKQVVIFSEKCGNWGCDECQKSLWRDGSQSVGKVSLCGHTTYKNETGRWPASDMIRVHEQYDTFSR